MKKRVKKLQLRTETVQDLASERTDTLKDDRPRAFQGLVAGGGPLHVSVDCYSLNPFGICS